MEIIELLVPFDTPTHRATVPSYISILAAPSMERCTKPICIEVINLLANFGPQALKIMTHSRPYPIAFPSPVIYRKGLGQLGRYQTIYYYTTAPNAKELLLAFPTSLSIALSAHNPKSTNALGIWQSQMESVNCQLYYTEQIRVG